MLPVEMVSCFHNTVGYSLWCSFWTISPAKELLNLHHHILRQTRPETKKCLDECCVISLKKEHFDPEFFRFSTEFSGNIASSQRMKHNECR